MSKELIEQLRELSANRKPYATGAHGQIIGMESYRIVANGFALECIDEAADRIEQLEKERDELMAALEPFAKVACLFDDDRRGCQMPASGVWQSWSRTDGDYELTVEDLRNARSAIAKLKGQS